MSLQVGTNDRLWKKNGEKSPPQVAPSPLHLFTRHLFGSRVHLAGMLSAARQTAAGILHLPLRCITPSFLLRRDVAHTSGMHPALHSMRVKKAHSGATTAKAHLAVVQAGLRGPFLSEIKKEMKFLTVGSRIKWLLLSAVRKVGHRKDCDWVPEADSAERSSLRL